MFFLTDHIIFPHLMTPSQAKNHWITSTGLRAYKICLPLLNHTYEEIESSTCLILLTNSGSSMTVLSSKIALGLLCTSPEVINYFSVVTVQPHFEVEALAIAAAIKHFIPYLMHSQQHPAILYR